MRTRRHAQHERIRSKEFQLKEVLQRQEIQRLLSLFPPGLHPSTPLNWTGGTGPGGAGGTSVSVLAPLTVVARAAQRQWVVDNSAVPNPIGGFQDIIIPSLNTTATLAADNPPTSFAGMGAGTYIVYAAHEYKEEHPETRNPPGVFADGAGVNATHQAFFEYTGETIGSPIPREAYDPSLTPVTVSEISDRIIIGVANENNMPLGVVPLLRVAWSGTAISSVTEIAVYSDLADYRTVRATLNEHVGGGGNRHATATPSVAGFMSPADKLKVDNLPTNTNTTLGNKADLVSGRVPLSQLPTSATANRVLKVGNANSNPTFSQVNFNELAGSIAQSQIPDGTVSDGKIASITGSKVSGLIPVASVPSHSTDLLTSGVLPVSRGGTGVGSLTGSRYIRTNSTGTEVETRTYAQTLADIGAAAASHNHAGEHITSGTVPIARLPTGTTASHVAVGNHTHTLAALGAAAASHEHSGAQITSGTVPIARLPVGTTASHVAAGNHTHTAAQVGAAAASHTHTIAQVTSLQTTLDGKSNTSHTHTLASLGAAAASHTHTIAQVTNLQSSLDGKSNTNHTHTPASIGAAAASHNHSGEQITSGTVPIARLPVGATNNTEVAPGQALTGSGNAQHPVGCLRLFYVSSGGGGGWTIDPGSVFTTDSTGRFVGIGTRYAYLANMRQEGAGDQGLFASSSGIIAQGTWQAISGARLGTGQAHYTGVVLAVRTA